MEIIKKITKKVPAEKAELLEKRKQRILDVIKKSEEKDKKAWFEKISEDKLKEIELKISKNEHATPEGKYQGYKSRVPVISPEMERFLFSYFAAGASLYAIYKRFGKEMGFSNRALQKAASFYKWSQRYELIRHIVQNEQTTALVDRFKNYVTFLDDLVSEAMIRFTENVENGKIKSPYETLKISNMTDLKNVITLLLDIANGGKKRLEITKRDSSSQTNLSDDKASRILEILADDCEVINEKEQNTIETKAFEVDENIED